jgi:hypothetical protein
MMQAVLHPDDVEGWQGEIRDSKVVDDGRNGERLKKTASAAKQKGTTEQGRASKRTNSSRTGSRTSMTRRRAPVKGGTRV